MQNWVRDENPQGMGDLFHINPWDADSFRQPNGASTIFTPGDITWAGVLTAPNTHRMARARFWDMREHVGGSIRCGGRKTMEAVEMLKTRRAVGVYERKPVPKNIIEDIVDCGRLAATAVNIWPWEFAVAAEPRMLHRIANITDYGWGETAANVRSALKEACSQAQHPTVVVYN